MDMKRIATENLILKVRTGSYMYGTSTPDSDTDYLGICIPPKEFILGMHTFEQYQEKTNPANSGNGNTKEDTDLTIYSLPKFIKLCTENNPNILELLYAPKNCIIYCNEFGEKLIRERNSFLSLRVKHKFGGYAYSQRHKVLRSAECYNKLYEMGVREDNIKEISNTMKDELKALGLKSGNRLSLIMRHGFDTKFASHLIRLLYFGLELLKEENLTLPTRYNNYLLDIKNGKFKLSEILEKASELEHVTELAYVSSNLKHSPNLERLNKFQIWMFEEWWKLDR